MFTNDGDFDFESWGQHLDHLVNAGIDGIFLLGTAGEFYAIPHSMKTDIIDFGIDRIAGRSLTLVGVASPVLSETLELAEYAAGRGASALVVIAPYFFPPKGEAIERHFGGIADAVDAPIWLYNNPLPTGFDITPEAAAGLVERHPNIVAVKDTVDVPGHTRQVIAAVRRVRPDVAVLSGTDEHYLLNRLYGGNGILGALTNVEPELFVSIHRAYEAGDLAAVAGYYQRVNVLSRLYPAIPEHVLGGVRIAVRLKGIDYPADTLAPATAITPDQVAVVQAILDEAAAVEIPPLR
ncbi:dihydrodipicolinate synthase family protein [Brooklawnia cerclae]